MATRARTVRSPRVIPRGKRSPRTPFGRSQVGVPPGDLTDFGCPDCRGVLAVREEGDRGHLSFACRVGHVYSGESLIKAKEEQLEGSLWKSVEVYEEVVLLHQEMAGVARANGASQIARAYERRQKRAVKSMSDLRVIISLDGPASADRTRG